MSSKRSKRSDEADKTPRPFKWLAAAIPLMAAALPIIGAFEHWFDTDSHSTPASLTEYAQVCGRANESQHSLEDDYTRYAVTFRHARDVTGASDALLLVTKQEMAATSDLKGRIGALTAPRGLTRAQRALEQDWEANLTELGAFRERLSQGVASLTDLVGLVRQQHRVAIASRSADARARLRQLGKQDCDLETEHFPPNVDWSPALKREWALAKRPPATDNGSPESASTQTPQVALPHETGELPNAEPPEAESTIPTPPPVVPEHVVVKPGEAIDGSSVGQPSTTTGP